MLEKQILSLLSFKEGKLPCLYLGLPLGKGLRSTKVWDPMGKRMDKKMESWKTKWLSWARKVIVLKKILSALPIYLMSYLSLSIDANSKLVKKIRYFYW